MTQFQKDNLYKLINARDPRYDGRFYFGVKTTGIYCRPVCPAKPLKKNVVFFKSKAEAETKGYRPCLRCRPDISPFSPMWEGSAATVSRALKIISSQESSKQSMEELSEKLGMSDRHLRRLFMEHLGASPMEIATSNRLHTARQFLSETDLPITEIAFASGFNSLRRFNDAFLKKYNRAPRNFRKQHVASANLQNTLTLRLPYLPPYDWDSIYNFLKRHSVYGSEIFEQGDYKRVLKMEDRVIEIGIKNNFKKNELIVSIANAKITDLKTILSKIKNLLDLEINPLSLEIPRGKVQLSGLRIPGCMDAFETAITIILGQVVTTEQASANVKKLVENFGKKIKQKSTQNHKASDFSYFFPTPQVLATADLSILRLPRARVSAIQELSAKVASGEISFHKLNEISVVREKLMAIKGIGPWTTEMIALRCFGDTNAFPQKDLIVLRAIEKLKIKPERYSPWRGYLTLWIWKNFAIKLSKKKNKETL